MKYNFITQVLWPVIKIVAAVLALLTVIYMSKTIDRQRTYIQQLEEVVDDRQCSFPERDYRTIPQPATRQQI